MSPLDAAHQLVARQPDHCPGCGAILWANGDHAPDCPWLSMPRIVAALEAAERVTAMHTENQSQKNCWFCRGNWHCPGDNLSSSYARFIHDPDCPGQALVAALKGEA